MTRFQKYYMAVFAVLVLIAGATASFAADAAKAPAAPAAKAPSNEVVNTGWQKRCSPETKEKKKDCEVFDKLEMKETSLRMAEFAIGFPQEKDLKKGTGRGVVILPLGILLEAGVTMKIDESKPFVFKPRYCTNAGCFSYVNLEKEVIDSMKKGKAISLLFKTAEGQGVNVLMQLEGFDKALQTIQ